MTAWAPKRFWSTVQAEPAEGGFTIRLDARLVKTPAKQPLVVPTLALAQAIAVEWEAQQGPVRPDTMPLTRAANSAIDKVAALFDGVVGEVAGYGATDLLCYRATAPQDLIDRQAAAWDPLLDWAQKDLAAPLRVTQGVIPVPQPEDSLNRLRAAVSLHTPFQMTALHDLVAISGSLILGLAVARKRLPAEQAFGLSRIDEHWQIEVWGDDDEAAVQEQARHHAFLTAERFFELCG